MTPAATLSVSRQFFRGYELCWGNGLPASNGEANALVPGVVCLAFSIELGLKAIILAAQGSAVGHKIENLFNLLSEDDQNIICRHTGCTREQFEHELSAVSNAFVEWRYIHEKPGFHSTSVQFLLALHAAIEMVAERNARAHRALLRSER